MKITGIILAAEGNWFSGLSDSFDLQLGLLIGSGLVAFALLVLSLTKWGYAKPVWKCVVLSVAAHILMIGFAYRTHLFFHTPGVVQSDTVRINLVDEGDTVDDLTTDTKENTEWDESAESQQIPDVDDLERAVVDGQLANEPEPEPLTSEVDFQSDLVFEVPDIARPAEPLAVPPVRPLDTEPFEVTEAVVNAQEIELNRREMDAQPTDALPDMEPADAIQRPDISMASSAVGESDTAPDDVQNEIATPFAGELVDDSARLLMTEPALPMARGSANMINVSDRYKVNEPGRGMESIGGQYRLGDGKPLPDLYKLRAAENRLMVAQRRGGSMETEQAVQAALKWLATHQSADGRWDPKQHLAGREAAVFGHNRQGAGSDADTGITALAVLAFMAGGNTHLEGPYQINVQKGLEFLLRNQAADGNLSGNAKLFARTYCHSMALLALSEAIALTGDSRLMKSVQRGVDFSVNAQNRTGGGWRYQPGDPGDMSQFGWQVLAMHSAQAGGVDVPGETLNRMKGFLNSCSSGVGNGLAAYRPRQQVSTTMTAEALVCRYFLYEEVRQDTKQQAASRLLRELPSERRMNLYYWYYGTMAMYQTGGEAWNRWNLSLKTALVKTQVMAGEGAGSWEPNGLWAGYGGRVYSTAMSTLCLEVYYRYLPMYEVAQAEAAAEAAVQTAEERQAGRPVIHR